MTEKLLEIKFKKITYNYASLAEYAGIILKNTI